MIKWNWNDNNINLLNDICGKTTESCYHCYLQIIFIVFFINVLTHRGQDKMATILQTTFSNAFTLTEFVGSIGPVYKIKAALVHIIFWLNRRQTIIWINDDLVHWCLNVSYIILNELTKKAKTLCLKQHYYCECARPEAICVGCFSSFIA